MVWLPEWDSSIEFRLSIEWEGDEVNEALGVMGMRGSGGFQVGKLIIKNACIMAENQEVMFELIKEAEKVRLDNVRWE